ncbi:hypothetical protein [Thalassolituus hydrocarboniclasticus]|uniref:Uncharacterized protein n=1 Tax=Thalassolituus hydrocarboniclasticus TaxID=2742796 RepID=A0ABY6A8W5_9GAMM|nr:hypothetical protein [Thalassolituus hydrocarboniclasticus]UXD86603.1 hypothetical protein HUF19_03705 [Thalassolituus hydrocarboniclasticus]
MVACSAAQGMALLPVEQGGPGIQRVPPALSGRTDASVYIVNLPSDSASLGLVGYTPQLSELIEDAMPLVWHLLARQSLPEQLPVYLFYVNPRDQIGTNAARLLQLLKLMSGKAQIWVPVSTSHSAILHSLRLILPEAATLDLNHSSLLYVGDNANRKPMKAMAEACGMSFCFHALY